MPLRLRLTGEGLRLTGSSRGARRPSPPPPPAQVLLATENGDLIVTFDGEHLVVERPHG